MRFKETRKRSLRRLIDLVFVGESKSAAVRTRFSQIFAVYMTTELVDGTDYKRDTTALYGHAFEVFYDLCNDLQEIQKNLLISSVHCDPNSINSVPNIN